MEKVSLPIKTKIAAWWMIGIVGIVILSCLASLSGRFFYPISRMICFVDIRVFAPLLFLLFCSYFLLKGKKEAWTFSPVILIGTLIWWWLIYKGFMERAIFTFLFFIPFVFLLSSRKELFKTAPEIKEKIILPIFTNVLGWIMVIIGGIATVVYFIFGGVAFTDVDYRPFILMILFLILVIISGLLILKKRKIGWWLTLFVFLILSIPLLSEVLTNPESQGYQMLMFLLFVSWILFLLDRKNFWKIAA